MRISDELIKISNLDKLSNDLEVDFISVEKEGKLDFIHISNIEYKNDIEKYGLFYGEGDLGTGIYIVDKNNTEGIDNLKTFISESFNYDEEKLLVVKGKYNGKYIECIYGYNHKGYVVVKNEISQANISNIYEEDINLFLLKSF